MHPLLGAPFGKAPRRAHRFRIMGPPRPDGDAFRPPLCLPLLRAIRLPQAGVLRSSGLASEPRPALQRRLLRITALSSTRGEGSLEPTQSRAPHRQLFSRWAAGSATPQRPVRTRGAIFVWACPTPEDRVYCYTGTPLGGGLRFYSAVGARGPLAVAAILASDSPLAFCRVSSPGFHPPPFFSASSSCSDRLQLSGSPSAAQDDRWPQIRWSLQSNLFPAVRGSLGHQNQPRTGYLCGYLRGPYGAHKSEIGRHTSELQSQR